MVRQNRVEIRHVCIGATEEGDHRFSVLMVLLCLRTSTVQTGLTRSILLYIRPSIYPSIHLCFYVSIHFSFCLSIYLYIPPPIYISTPFLYLPPPLYRVNPLA